MLAVPRVEHFLYPATIYVGLKPSSVQTILGSCVAVCIFDPVLSVGGINHFMLPYWNGDGLQSPKYGDVAIARLIERMMQYGCKRQNLTAKIFGGADQHSLDFKGFEVGLRNISAAETLLQVEQIQIVARSTGGNIGRKLVYDTHTNSVFMKFLQANN